MNEDIERNKRLCHEFPFLIPRNSYTGEQVKGYEYDYTYLDELPRGWQKRFCIDMCKEIKASLEEEKKMDDYKVVQVKEKYGMMCWYDADSTEKIEREIIPKYMKLSEHTCAICGDEATLLSKGWIMPFCENCAGERRNIIQFVPLGAM